FVHAGRHLHNVARRGGAEGENAAGDVDKADAGGRRRTLAACGRLRRPQGPSARPGRVKAPPNPPAGETVRRTRAVSTWEPWPNNRREPRLQKRLRPVWTGRPSGQEMSNSAEAMPPWTCSVPGGGESEVSARWGMAVSWCSWRVINTPGSSFSRP